MAGSLSGITGVISSTSKFTGLGCNSSASKITPCLTKSSALTSAGLTSAKIFVLTVPLSGITCSVSMSDSVSVTESFTISSE